MSRTSIRDLPLEVLEKALIKLPSEDIDSYCLSYPGANAICSDNQFWINKLDLDFTKRDIIPSTFIDDSQYDSGRAIYAKFKEGLEFGVKHIILQGYLDIAKWLIHRGDRLDMPNGSDMDIIVMGNRLDILDYFKIFKIYPTIDGMRYAVQNGLHYIVEWLVLNNFGKNLLTVSGGDRDLYQILVAHGFKPEPDWMQKALENDRADTLDWLYKNYNLVPTVRDLDIAIMKMKFATADWMVERGIRADTYILKPIIQGKNFHILNWFAKHNLLQLYNQQREFESDILQRLHNSRSQIGNY